MSKKEIKIVLACFFIVVSIDLGVRQYFNIQHNKRAEREALNKELDGYMACKGNVACQNLYPRAVNAVRVAKEQDSEEDHK